MDAAAELFSGTWRFSVQGDFACDGYIHFSKNGRLVQGLVVKGRPQQKHIFDFAYEIETPGVLRIRPKLDHAGWTRTYSFKGCEFSMSSGALSWLMSRIEGDEIPDWFVGAVDAALKE